MEPTEHRLARKPRPELRVTWKTERNIGRLRLTYGESNSVIKFIRKQEGIWFAAYSPDVMERFRLWCYPLDFFEVINSKLHGHELGFGEYNGTRVLQLKQNETRVNPHKVDELTYKSSPVYGSGELQQKMLDILRTPLYEPTEADKKLITQKLIEEAPEEAPDYLEAAREVTKRFTCKDW